MSKPSTAEEEGENRTRLRGSFGTSGEGESRENVGSKDRSIKAVQLSA